MRVSVEEQAVNLSTGPAATNRSIRETLFRSAANTHRAHCIGGARNGLPRRRAANRRARSHDAGATT
ncbi:hypothetical protein GSH05_00140 [Burkholderia pseudomallei]|nr:hypothetical protein BOC59_29435 [Burkholderia pseudomallei]PNX00743.1 hypothetical protein CF649_21655 [Burkholderia sp. 136(2017)]PNX27441.1 hypothetical protein CF647_21320 [Burkholderia sp. 117]PNX36093.1 hypothetical protein CF648_22565 [Burkholderia sp. 137]AUG23760.1 hypothetical protein CXQ84_24865 [Burkholderia pseudomallei]